MIPFECLSPDLEPARFSEGLNQALVAEIAKLKSAQVISPSTVQRYRRLRIPTAIMARLLGLDVIVEGTAQRFGPQVRISVRLTDVHSGKLIWADGYDVAAADINQAEATVAQRGFAANGTRQRRGVLPCTIVSLPLKYRHNARRRTPCKSLSTSIGTRSTEC